MWMRERSTCVKWFEKLRGSRGLLQSINSWRGKSLS